MGLWNIFYREFVLDGFLEYDRRRVDFISDLGDFCKITIDVIAVDNGDALWALHLIAAQELLSNRKNTDYRNSIKESISAVECVVKEISGDKNAELKTALNKIEATSDRPLHVALKQGLLKIYGYTSDGDGIRHALKEEVDVEFDDAKFMLVACSAFVNYLISKSK